MGRLEQVYGCRERCVGRRLSKRDVQGFERMAVKHVDEEALTGVWEPR